MKIIAIEKPTAADKFELEKLKQKSRQQTLSVKEKDRELFLQMKQFWNCEC